MVERLANGDIDTGDIIVTPTEAHEIYILVSHEMDNKYNLGNIETAFMTLLNRMEENMPDYDEDYANEVREEVEWAHQVFKESIDAMRKSLDISDDYLTNHYLT